MNPHPFYNQDRFPIAVALSPSRGLVRKHANSDVCGLLPFEGTGYAAHAMGTTRDVRRLIAQGYLLPAMPTDNRSPENYE